MSVLPIFYSRQNTIYVDWVNLVNRSEEFIIDKTVKRELYPSFKLVKDQNLISTVVSL
jgi:hypothetical protein